MDVVEAIRSRRMLPKVGAQRPSRAEVEELLELAVRAPSHHLTEPWRFRVLTGEGLDRLAACIASSSDAPREEAIEEARKKVARAPVVIVVTCVPSEAEGVVEQEEIVSCGMAMQNILLAAQAKGLGVMLRTGPAAYHGGAREHLELEPNERVVGFLYLGYPAGDRSLTPRAPASERTQWIGWD